MDPELKSLLDAQTKTFEEFKAANDAAQTEIKKLGAADAVTAEKVEKINKALDEVSDQIKAATKRADEIEAKANRMALTGNGSDAEEVKSAAAFGRQVGAEMNVDDFRAYKSALNVALRKGNATPAAELKALSVGSDPDGGYLVTPDTSGRVVKKVYETSPIRQLATVMTIGTDTIEGMIDNGEVDYGWVGETQARNDTNTSQLGKWSIVVNEMYAQPTATQKALDDAQWDLEAWLANKVADKFARVENAAFLNGDGVLKPRGLLSYPSAQTDDKSGRAWGTFEFVPTGSAGNITADSIFNLVYALKTAYRGNARFLTARATVGAIRKLKDSQGRYLWEPALTGGQPSSLLGFPVAEGEDMPAMASGSISMAFGDFAETYTIVDRAGISVLRDPYTVKGFVKFYTRRRTGGGALNFESMKFLKLT